MLTGVAVLQLMPGSRSVLVSSTGAKRRIQCPVPNGDVTFFQGTFQLVNASIRTFCNNVMKVRPVKSGGPCVNPLKAASKGEAIISDT